MQKLKSAAFSMLGDNILVAPVFSDDTANFYLPEGKWTW